LFLKTISSPVAGFESASDKSVGKPARRREESDARGKRQNEDSTKKREPGRRVFQATVS
jgi:hypothetical protein